MRQSRLVRAQLEGPLGAVFQCGGLAGVVAAFGAHPDDRGEAVAMLPMALQGC